MLPKAFPVPKVTAVHAEMTVAQAVVLQGLLVLVVVIVVAHKAAVVVMAAVLHLRPQPKHKNCSSFN
jgi:hypothetical protein